MKLFLYSAMHCFASWLKVKTCKHSNKETIFECYQERYMHEKCNDCGADIYSDL